MRREDVMHICLSHEGGLEQPAEVPFYENGRGMPTTAGEVRDVADSAASCEDSPRSEDTTEARKLILRYTYPERGAREPSTANVTFFRLAKTSILSVGSAPTESKKITGISAFCMTATEKWKTGRGQNYELLLH